MFFGYPAEHGGAVHVHQQGDGHHGKGPPGESDFRFIVKQAVYGLPDNPSASDQEQGRFRQGGKVLYLFMPVGMAFIRRACGYPYGVKGHSRRHQVQSAVQSLRDNAQAARFHAGPDLDSGQEGRPQDGGEGRA